MATAHPVKQSAASRTREPLAMRIARSVVSMALNDLPAEVTGKVKLCLFDLIGCASIARSTWSRSGAVGFKTCGVATVIGLARRFPRRCGVRNAVRATSGARGHALGSISPSIWCCPVLALPIRLFRAHFIAAAVVATNRGQIARAVWMPKSRHHRPTGITVRAAAAAGARRRVY